MMGLRDVRRELETIRHRAMSAEAGGLVVVEAADGFPQAGLDAFLDEQIGRDRDHIDVMVLRRSADEMRKPTKISGKSDESLSSILQAVDGKSRGLPSERESVRRAMA